MAIKSFAKKVCKKLDKLGITENNVCGLRG
jgi:hypothetical protein